MEHTEAELEQRLKAVEARLDEVDKFYADVKKEFNEMDELGVSNDTKCPPGNTKQ